MKLKWRIGASRNSLKSGEIFLADPPFNPLDALIKGRRSLQAALADLRAQYALHPTAELARIIQQLEAEIAIRRRRPKKPRTER